jgi:hypothetical protein
MQVQLAVQHKKANTRQVRLGPDTMIGRAPECQLRIASTEVSRRHCRIQVTDRTICIRDLGSANGTFLNGQQIPPSLNVQIVDGDTLRIGPVQFLVQCIGSDTVLPNPAGDDLLSDTADHFENVRVINAEAESDSGGDEPLPVALPRSDDRLPHAIPPADDAPPSRPPSDTFSLKADDSGEVPGGATVYDRSLPNPEPRAESGSRPVKKGIPPANAPRSGANLPARAGSSGTIRSSKSPTTPSVPVRRGGSSADVPARADTGGADAPPANLMGMLGLLSEEDLPRPGKPTKPKRPPPPAAASDDLDLTLRTDDDDHSSGDATIHAPRRPGRKQPDSSGVEEIPRSRAEEPPKEPAKKPQRKPPPAHRPDSSIPASSDDDDQAMADFLKGFDR